jgi:hypothetical protein
MQQNKMIRDLVEDAITVSKRDTMEMHQRFNDIYLFCNKIDVHVS